MNKKLPITSSNSTESICFFFYKTKQKKHRYESNFWQNEIEREIANHVFMPEAIIYALMCVRGMSREEAEKV